MAEKRPFKNIIGGWGALKTPPKGTYLSGKKYDVNPNPPRNRTRYYEDAETSHADKASKHFSKDEIHKSNRHDDAERAAQKLVRKAREIRNARHVNEATLGGAKLKGEENWNRPRRNFKDTDDREFEHKKAARETKNKHKRKYHEKAANAARDLNAAWRPFRTLFKSRND